MKVLVCLCIILIHYNFLNAQNKKDTLYFQLDKDYMVNGDEFKHLSPSQFNKMRYAYASKTETNGYFYYIVGEEFENLNTEKAVSLKEYIENRTFYIDGEHNRIIDKWKLRELFFDRFIIFFVEGNTSYLPRHIQYNMYYPYGKGHESIDPRVKDTLFFSYDSTYISTNMYNPGIFTIADSSADGSFYFDDLGNVDIARPDFLLSLKKYIRKSRFYCDKDYCKRNLLDQELSDYLRNYIVLLFNEDECILVSSNFGIE